MHYGCCVLQRVYSCNKRFKVDIAFLKTSLHMLCYRISFIEIVQKLIFSNCYLITTIIIIIEFLIAHILMRIRMVLVIKCGFYIYFLIFFVCILIRHKLSFKLTE